MIVKKVQKTEW